MFRGKRKRNQVVERSNSRGARPVTRCQVHRLIVAGFVLLAALFVVGWLELQADMVELFKQGSAMFAIMREVL
jgi:hypothetical protein